MDLYSARLHIRPVLPSDADSLFDIYGDPATNLFNPAGPYPDLVYAKKVLSHWLTHWDTHGFGNYAIALQSAPAAIIGFGGLSFHTYAGMTIHNLGYRFAVSAWGKGLATEFARRILDYGFTDLQFAEISAVARANHTDSQNVLMKVGMDFIQVIPDTGDAPPRWLYTLTADQWRRDQSSYSPTVC